MRGKGNPNEKGTVLERNKYYKNHVYNCQRKIQ